MPGSIFAVVIGIDLAIAVVIGNQTRRIDELNRRVLAVRIAVEAQRVTGGRGGRVRGRCRLWR